MPLINRFTINEKGSMIFTGNTLGLSSNNLDIGAFTTLDQTSQVAGFPAGTTLVWQNNSSSAQFTLPPGATVLYAELQWGGSYTGGTVQPSDLETPITFTTPGGVYSIPPDPNTAQQGPLFYSRSQDVTSIIQNDGSGTYTVAGVPAVIGPFQDPAGWTLGIIYKDPSLPYRNMSIYSGIQEIAANAPPIDFNLSGFLAPYVGPVEGRVLLSAMEGDYSTPGDQILFGPNTGSLVALSGPNNAVNNFFASQINDGNSESPTVGQLDTSGTFGSINRPADLPARYGWDITNVETTNFVNGQTEAVVRITSTGDGYAVPLMGIQLDSLPLDFGDAPNTDSTTQGPGNYRSLQESNGPIHILGDSQSIFYNLTLGTQVTADSNASQNILATGDDLIRSIPDDGTTLPLIPMAYNAPTYSVNVVVNNKTGSTANVYAWLDFNQDGIFQTNEGFVTTVPSLPTPQTIPLNFTRPAGSPTPIGNTYIRVRTTTNNLINTGGLAAEDTRSYGLATDGEVEDYFLPITNQPFNCSSYGYRVAQSSLTANSSLTQVNLVTGTTLLIKSDIGLPLNAIGYNTLNNLIYGIEAGTTNLIVMDVTGNIGNIGPVPNLPYTASYNVGAIDDNGHLFIKSTTLPIYYVIDVNPSSSTYGQLLDPTAGYVLDTAPYGTAITPTNMDVYDWAFNANDGLLYGISGTTVLRMNPTTGIVTALTTTGIPAATAYGSVYSVSDGFIYATSDDTGIIYRIAINGNNADALPFSQDTPTLNSDGASCLNAILRIDFGDAPNTNTTTQSTNNYRTLLSANGPRHGLVNNLKLGTTVTAEADAYQNPTATGDDIPLSVPDDGTTLPLTNMALNASSYTLPVRVFNDTGSPANVYGWIDFNKNGIFETNEGATAVVPSSTTNPQTVNLVFNVPAGTTLTPGDTFVRVRTTTTTLTNAGSTTAEDTRSYGPASDGEVEDYLLTIEDTKIIPVKSVNKTLVNPGDTITYTVTLKNPGTLPINGVLFQDTIPANTTYANNLSVSTAYTGTTPQTGLTITTIAANETVTISWDVTVNANAPAGAVIPNTGTVTIPTLPPTPTNKVDSAVVDVRKSVDKTVAGVGDILTYTITVTNNSSVAALNTFFQDTLPSGTVYNNNLTVSTTYTGTDPMTGLTLLSIPAKSTATISWKVKITATPNGNLIPNVGIITLPGSKPTPTNKVETIIPIVQKSVDKQVVNTGDRIKYTVTVKNPGAVAISNILFTDSIPPGTTYNNNLTVSTAYSGTSPQTGLTLTTIQPGETVTISWEVKVGDTVPTPNPIENTATVTPPGVTPTPSNKVYTTVLEIKKAVDKAYGDLGEVLTYTITIKNPGTVAANNISFQDSIPSGTTYNNNLTVSTAYTGSTPQTGLVLTTIQPGETVTISFQVKVGATLPTPNPIPNTGIVTVPGGNPTPTNKVTTQINTADITTPGNTVKSANKIQTTPGDIVTYTVVVKNTGNVAANNVLVTDIVPTGTSFITGTVTIDSVTQPTASPIAGISLGTVNPSQTKTITFKVLVGANAPNPLINTATTTYNYTVEPTKPPVTPPPTITPPVTIPVLKPGLSIVKSSNRKGAVVGDTITYTLTIKNTGQMTDENVVITDPLTPDVTFAGNVKLNGSPIAGNITTGINIGNLAVGQSAILTFDAVVKSVPNNPDKTIVNQSDASYTYRPNPTDPLFPGTSTSNKNIVKVYSPQLTVTKTSSAKDVLINIPFNYTIVVANTGDILLNNVVVADPLPTGFTITNLTIDGLPLAGNLQTGINIGNLDVGKSRTIVATVVIDDTVNLTTFKNIATATGTATVDPNFPPVTVTTNGKHEVGINIYNPKLKLTKTGDKKDVVIGDIVTYTIVANNITGNLPLNNVIVSDSLNSSLEFVLGSVTVNGVSTPDASILSGVNIGSLAINQSKIITFKAKVISADVSPIVNISHGNFTFTLPNGFKSIGDTDSNPYNVYPYLAEVQVKKSATPDTVLLGDTITYTIVLTNTGNIPALNVLFTDKLPPEVELIPGTFTVGGKVINGVNLVTGINVGTIPPNGQVTITFQAKVITTNCSSTLTNVANGNFSYRLPDGSTGSLDVTANTDTSTGTPSNIAITPVGLSTFKQLSTEMYLGIPAVKPDIEAINLVTGTINITNCHVITTSTGTSTEGQTLTGYKLILRGSLEIVVEYTALDTEQSVHSAHYTIPFTTFIILPSTYVLGSKLDPTGLIEDIYYKQVDTRTFFVNVTELINVKIVSC